MAFLDFVQRSLVKPRSPIAPIAPPEPTKLKGGGEKAANDRDNRQSLSKPPTMIANTAIRAAARVGSRRPMSTVAAPKMHKAKDAWSELQKTRPPPGHPHVSETLARRWGRRGGWTPPRTAELLWFGAPSSPNYLFYLSNSQLAPVSTLSPVPHSSFSREISAPRSLERRLLVLLQPDTV